MSAMTPAAIFEPDALDGYELCHPTDQEDFEQIICLIDGVRRRDGWRPIAVEVIHEDEGVPLRESDSPWLGPHALVFRPRAVDALGAMLRRHGELLPLRCEEAGLSIFNVTAVPGALDENASEIVRFGSGRIMTVDRYVFRPEAVDGIDVFKVPELRASPAFVSERFVRQWRSAGLRGLGFRRVWQPGGCTSWPPPPRSR
jgi:hypothetical protein